MSPATQDIIVFLTTPFVAAHGPWIAVAVLTMFADFTITRGKIRIEILYISLPVIWALLALALTRIVEISIDIASEISQGRQDIQIPNDLLNYSFYLIAWFFCFVLIFGLHVIKRESQNRWEKWVFLVVGSNLIGLGNVFLYNRLIIG